MYQLRLHHAHLEMQITVIKLFRCASQIDPDLGIDAYAPDFRPR